MTNEKPVKESEVPGAEAAAKEAENRYPEQGSHGSVDLLTCVQLERSAFIAGASWAAKGGEWQLCPKCNGDGNLARYNSPAMISTDASLICDVCNGAKIIAKPSWAVGEKWISVDDRLPEINDRVVVYTAMKYPDTIMVGYRNNLNGGWFDEEANFLQISVTHWMPLPTPPIKNANQIKE